MSDGEVEDEQEPVDSGPFCRHWRELGDCDERCICSHRCDQHDSYGDGECNVDGCPCEAFKDADPENA